MTTQKSNFNLELVCENCTSYLTGILPLRLGSIQSFHQLRLYRWVVLIRWHKSLIVASISFSSGWGRNKILTLGMTGIGTILSNVSRYLGNQANPKCPMLFEWSIMTKVKLKRSSWVTCLCSNESTASIVSSIIVSSSTVFRLMRKSFLFAGERRFEDQAVHSEWLYML